MASSREIEQAAAGWLARRDGGHWIDAEQRALDAWLAASTAHQVAFVRLQTAWEQSGRLKALGAGMPAGTLPERGQWSGAPPPADRPLQVSRRRAARPARRPLPRLVAVAASLVAAVVLAMGWHYYTGVTRSSYATAIGELKVVPLADGSTATLSSDSRITVSYSHGRRDIHLEQGEAYFSVAKDHSRPFVVGVEQRQVIAVGTRFDVRRRADGIRVVVTHGLVRLVTPQRPGELAPLTTLLPAGSVARSGREGVVVRADTVQQAENYVSWRDGFLSFHDTPLTVAVAELNRYNVRQIVIDDPAVGAIRVGGHFRWSNADAFVRLLTRGLPVSASEQGGQIALHHR